MSQIEMLLKTIDSSPDADRWGYHLSEPDWRQLAAEVRAVLASNQRMADGLLRAALTQGCGATPASGTVEELEALRLVHLEARELVGEADATGEIPQANVNALRSLLWRATMKAERIDAILKGVDNA